MTSGSSIVRSLVTTAECTVLAAAFQRDQPRLRSEGRRPFVDRVVRAARHVPGDVDRVRTAVFHARASSELHVDVVNSYIYPSYTSVWIAVVEPVHIAVAGDEIVLAPGDAWIARNDVLHRVDGNELVLEFRAICTAATITRAQLMDMGAIKFDHMARMRTLFARRFATFQIAQRDALSLADYDAIYDELELRELALCKQLGGTRLSNSRFEDLVYDMTIEHARRQERA